MANSAEILHFLKSDRNITLFSHQVRKIWPNIKFIKIFLLHTCVALLIVKFKPYKLSLFHFKAQDLLADAVYLSFKQLVRCLRADLELAIPALLFDGEDDVHDDENISATTRGVIKV